MTDLAGVLARARAAANSRMRTILLIDRIRRDDDGEPITNTSPEGEVTAVRDEIYSGKGRVHYPGTPWPATPDVAGQQTTVRPLFVSIPSDAATVEVGDRIIVVSDLDTPKLAGNTYRAIEPGNASQESAQRILCQDYSTSPLGQEVQP